MRSDLEPSNSRVDTMKKGACLIESDDPLDYQKRIDHIDGEIRILEDRKYVLQCELDAMKRLQER